MKILITGANGQIGTSLVAALVARGHEVVATDIHQPEQLPDHTPEQLPDHTPEHTSGRATWHHLDVTRRDEVDAVVADSAPDLVFHLAAILSARGEKAPHLTYEVNQSGTYHLLGACQRHGVKKLMFTSTIAVYGPDLPDPTPDDVPLHPTTMYGVTKVSGELLCEYYRQRYGMDVRGVRFPGLISAELPGGGTSDYALYMFTEGIRTGRYQAYCRPDTRIPLMYMPDGVRALLELAGAPRQRLSRCIYNVTAFSPTADSIARAASRAIGDVSITFVPDPPRQAILDSWPRSLDDTCARRDWDWRARYDLDQMTADLVPRLRALMAEHAHALQPADSALPGERAP